MFNSTKGLHLLHQCSHRLLERYGVDNFRRVSLSAVISTAIGTVPRTEKELTESFCEYFPKGSDLTLAYPGARVWYIPPLFRRPGVSSPPLSSNWRHLPVCILGTLTLCLRILHIPSLSTKETRSFENSQG